MTRVVSLTDLVPPPRYDGNPWTGAQVLEAAVPDSTGTIWTQIDEQAFSSGTYDSDPTAPAPRSVTTSNATLGTGWYRLVFTDAAAGVSEPSQAIRSSIDAEMPPAPIDIRNLSPLLRQQYPLPATDPYALSDLRANVYAAIMAVQAITWRLIDPTLGCPAPEGYGYSCELLQPEMVDIARQAIVRLTERYAVISQPAYATQFATGRRLAGFSAGPYSERYFAPNEFARRGVVSRPSMDDDDTINSALWALATEDARDYFVWRNTGAAPPTGVPSVFDYRRESIGYGAGQMGVPGGYAHGGPDGF